MATYAANTACRRSNPPLSTHQHFTVPVRSLTLRLIGSSKRFGLTSVAGTRCLASRDGCRETNTSAAAFVATSVAGSTIDLEMEEREPSVSTILTGFGNSFDPYDALSTPLYQTATLKQPSATENGPYDYTRSGNPTRDVLERLLAKLEKADRALCFTSGMAALAAVTHLVETGQEIVAGDDIYGGSDRLLSKVVPKKGIVVKRVDTTDLNEVSSAIGPRTRLV